MCQPATWSLAAVRQPRWIESCLVARRSTDQEAKSSQIKSLITPIDQKRLTCCARFKVQLCFQSKIYNPGSIMTKVKYMLFLVECVSCLCSGPNCYSKLINQIKSFLLVSVVLHR